MAFKFTDPARSPYRTGGLFLGHDSEGREIGVTTEKHAITIAPTRTGKGATLIIPNLRRWPESALVIDPKGENATVTWRDRVAMGQKVAVFDPFHEAEGIPPELRVSFNPLAAIDAHRSGARETLQVIADGLVKSHDPRHMEWVEGARALIAGLAAYVVETATPKTKTFQAVRALLLLPDEDLHAEAQAMQQCTGAGGLAAAAGSEIITALESTKGMERDFLGGARRATKWLDSPEIAATLAASNFDLAELKNGKTTVFIVLPFDYIDMYSSYMRLLVRYAISAMGRTKGNGQCLFLLDEFFALGKIDEIRASAAQMASYGVKLWPFLQDLGQLQELYGLNAAQTFFANADLHIFFGATDPLTLDFISKALDNTNLADLDVLPPTTSAPPVAEWERSAATRQLLAPNVVPFPASGKNSLGALGMNWAMSAMAQASHEAALGEQAEMRANIEARMEAHRAAEASDRAAYEHTMRTLGQPRLYPQQIRELIGKKDADPVARSMIVFGKGGDIFNLRPAPYYVEDQQQAAREEAATAERERAQEEWDRQRPAHALPLQEWYDSGFRNVHPDNVRPIKQGDPFYQAWHEGRRDGQNYRYAEGELNRLYSKRRALLIWRAVLAFFACMTAIMGGGAVVLLHDPTGWGHVAVAALFVLLTVLVHRAIRRNFGEGQQALKDMQAAKRQLPQPPYAADAAHPCGHVHCPLYEMTRGDGPSAFEVIPQLVKG